MGSNRETSNIAIAILEKITIWPDSISHFKDGGDVTRCCSLPRCTVCHWRRHLGRWRWHRSCSEVICILNCSLLFILIRTHIYFYLFFFQNIYLFNIYYLSKIQSNYQSINPGMIGRLEAGRRWQACWSHGVVLQPVYYKDISM